MLQQCPDCARTTGIDADARDTIQHEACCDAEVVDLRPGPKKGHLLVHEGELAIYTEKGGHAIEHADGRVAHVGHGRMPVWMSLQEPVPHPRL